MNEINTLILAQKNIKLDQLAETDLAERAYYLGKEHEDDVSYHLEKSNENLISYLKAYQLNDGVSNQPENIYLYLFDEKKPQKHQMSVELESNSWVPVESEQGIMPFDTYFELHAEKRDTKKL